jgi:FtsP/CotA-like multicopper oxidase with cupredoxin domain
MQWTKLNSVLKTTTLAACLLGAGAASAAEVYLKAQSVDKDVGDGVMLEMWNFVCDDAAAAPATNEICTQTTAGAQIDIDANVDAALTVHLTNDLPVEVSITVPGQAGGGDPEIIGGRVRSFTHEVAPGMSADYSWSNLRPGTYLYQSATHPSLQVPMGLFGALVVTDVAYPGPAYANDAILLFSEVDPIQNGRVAAAASGGITATQACVSLKALAGGATDGYPCTIDYSPMYFLVNGAAAPNLDGFTAGETVLLRLLNAGLRSHTPALVGIEMILYAEDGNSYPGNPLQQAEALLPAGKTIDALVTLPATTNLTVALLDRSPTFSDENQPNGGAWATVQLGTGTEAPLPATVYAVNDEYPNVVEDTPYSGSTVLINDVNLAGASVALVGQPANGSVQVNTNGTFEYSPNLNFSGTDTFTYSASLDGSSYPAQVMLNVSFVNDPAEAFDDEYRNTVGGTTLTVAAPGVLANDIDVDGDTLEADLVTGAGVMFNADGSFEYTGTSTSFTYRVREQGSANAWSAPATVDLTVNAASGIDVLVSDPDGMQITNYRWLVQEDTMYRTDPDSPPADINEQQALNFHKSYLPVVAQGCVGADGSRCKSAQGDDVPDFPLADAALDPSKQYYLSILPSDAGTGTGHTIGGAQILPGATSVDVIVNRQEIPYAQVSVQVFEDVSPTNGAIDANEPGLGGFQIILEDAGGRYGISGGTMSQDANGTPLTNGADCAPSAPQGVILTCADGSALIKNLPPGKYGVIAVPPASEASAWTQTSTIEGSKVIDAWVKANEPAFFLEFGKAAPHAFIGFVNPERVAAVTAAAGISGENVVSGNVTLLHDPRPGTGELGSVDANNFEGLAFTRAWVGVNTIGGDGRNIATVHAEPDGSFSIPNLPNGAHQLVIWDDYLDVIIAFRSINLPADAADAPGIGNIGVNAWFTRTEHNVFLDSNDNHSRDDGEGLSEQAILLRWRDGTINQAFPTDLEGFVSFDQTFPFFNWQVMEVDYTRFKATGLTVTVDAGGIDSNGDGLDDGNGVINPQDLSPRYEEGAVLTQGFQGFPGQTTIFDWEKAPYEAGENGGISGIVFYGSTRGENDPRLTAGDPWEPGIPSVAVRLYRETAREFGEPVLALVAETATDSWDDSLPTGCPGEDPLSPFAQDTLGVANIDKCYDGYRNWNQARPAVFDGGYAFNDIPAGKYVVEVVVPTGYELIKEEDLNVGFGDTFGPGAGTGFAAVSVVLPNGMLVYTTPDMAMIEAAMGADVGLAQPPCVGEYHTVADELSLFPGEAAPFAGAARPLCDRKEVFLPDQGQAAAEFHLFTTTPIAAQFTGLALDDITVEPDPASPGFGEKWAPANLPISIRDFNGLEVYRTYGDAFGHFNGILPSTFTANVPIPSGYSPAMNLACMNDPGDGVIPDPHTMSSYGTACYTLQFMPGTTTYLDTPVLPQAAFAGGYNPVDCRPDDASPMIMSVTPWGGSNQRGPWMSSGSNNGSASRLRITSAGTMDVPNPAYDGPLGSEPKTISRDLGFGSAEGRVLLNGQVLDIQGGGGWTDGQINVNTPDGAVTGQLVVERANGNRSVNAVTFTKEVTTPIFVSPGESIQAAIDAAGNGDLIIVEEGTYYEQIIMWKPVRLQGVGSATVINAGTRQSETLEEWNTKLQERLPLVDLLPGQDPTFSNEQAAGITVLAKRTGANRFSNHVSRIDGFTITGAYSGGGLLVSGYATNLEVSNNQITGNSGDLGGGIRVGHPNLPGLTPANNGLFAFNNNVKIHNNSITLNGANGQEATGAGVAMSTGSNGYAITDNFICGNYTTNDGAGIGHYGQSNNGVIQGNTIVFNQSLNLSNITSGGGVFIGGEPPAPPALTLGTGNVLIDSNVIQGNNAGSGHGGGIRTQYVNGATIPANADANTDRGPWRLQIFNNMIVNNVAAYSGGGISLQDTINARIHNNTIANNDTTATVGSLIVAGTSEPQPAGISTGLHSPELAAIRPSSDPGFSTLNPGWFTNNIIWHNRAFSYDGAKLMPELTQAAVGDCDAGAIYWDLGVLGQPLVNPALKLTPRRAALSDLTDYAGRDNIEVAAADMKFVDDYCNGSRMLNAPGPMLATGAFGEGGNFLDVRYGPLTRAWPDGSAPWDYHLATGSAAIDNAWGGRNTDIDGEDRPATASSTDPSRDRGADEVVTN